ncbi:alpha/beta fold hydrolase [Sphingomonas oligophenolica]|uniref:Alpha/beta hydrolase n=1 Tax=Sphingomonas oligophenolica TaxID=301154 RepID=A0A502CJM2_9SPHN|nr:alpha/beta fold hydrolase [Sphingomonas oligophenolica]TPG13013.1 alpha/beta hydrolase [Sphingomonas oligophenolica]
MLRSETAARPDEFGAAMAGLRAYQQAERPPARPPAPAVQHAGRVCLRDHGGGGRPVVFVPSLINPPAILDLGEASLLCWMAGRGFRTLLVDWGAPTAADRNRDLADHVADMLVPLIEVLDEPPVLVGYCLGGTIATAAAALTPVAGLATIAAPWRFAGYGDARETMQAMWRAAEPACDALGLVPMEVLQSGFWRLDPRRTVAKYAAFGRMAPDSDAARAFVMLEDWANAGAPLPYAVGRDLFDRFVRDDLPGTGDWRVRDTAIDPHRLPCPTIEFVSATDRIVPAATAAGLAERRDLMIGHVGMVVGSRARAALWEPLADWAGGLDRVAATL